MSFYKEAIEVLTILVRALHGDARDGWRYQPSVPCRYRQRAFDSRRFLCNRRKTSPCNRRTTTA